LWPDAQAKGIARATFDQAFAGLAKTGPARAALMTVFLLSLAGIPPTAGFIAKVAVFGAAVRAGHWPLVLIAVLASVVAAFFYIRVIVLMYMREPEGAEAPRAGREALVVAVPPRGVVGPSELPAAIAQAAQLSSHESLESARLKFEERFVRAALARAAGHRGQTAAAIGLSRQGLAKLMQRLHLDA